MDHFIEIIQTDSFKAFKLFCVFFQMDLGKILKLIGKNETIQYGILKVKQIDDLFYLKIFIVELFCIYR
jgi:hypothetical protein